MVVASCLGAGILYQQWTNPAAVRQQVVEMLAKQFPGATITLDGARLRLFGGVVLSELRLLRHGEGDGEEADLVHIPEAIVYPDKERLLDGKFALRRIEMHHPRVRIVRNKEGKWNIEGLAGKSASRGPLPTTVIHDGTLVVEDHGIVPATWEMHDVNLTIINDPVNSLTISGSGQSETLGALEVHGSWNRDTNAATVSLQAAGMRLTPDLVQYVASQAAAERLKDLHLEGRADIKAEFNYQPGATPALKHDVHCQLRQATVEHPALPLRLHNLSAALQCTQSKLILAKLKAAAGAGKIEGHAWVELPNLEDTFAAELTASYLPLTQELAERLPTSVRRLHELFQPDGSAKVQFTCEKQKGQWVRNYCVLNPNEISICFKHFKYPIDRVTGFIDYDCLQHTSKFDAVGFSGTQPLTLRGNWKGTGPQAEAVIEIAGQNIPLDNKLYEALPPRIKAVAESFHAKGKGHFRGVIRRVPGSVDYKNTYQVHFVDCDVRWEKFPYPLEHVDGDLLIYPGFYEFKNFHGTHNGAEVFVHGQTLRCEGKDDGKLVVNIMGRNLGLDGDLQQALEKFPGLKKTWETFSPKGRLCFQARVDQVPEQQQDLDITVDVAGCAIKPSFFRYSLHDVAGQFRYHHNKVELTNFTAKHDTSQLSIDHGTVDLFPRGGFYVELDDLRGNPVLADQELLAALPAALRTTVEAIHLKDQPFALQTKIVVAQGAEPAQLPEFFWDGQLWVRDAELRAGIDLNRVTGTVACRGLHNGRQMVGLCGNVYLNEASVYNQPLLGVRSHFVVRESAPDVMLFGLRAPVFGGDISGQGRLEFNSSLRYEIDLTASQIQLEEFGRHNLGPNHQLAGIAAGRLHLQGQGADLNGLEGNGSIDVPYSPMTRLLNLPLLLDLLKFLGLRWPDRTAFEEAHAAFSIHGNRMSISQLDLLGNAVSLYGKGEVNLDGTDLQLDMFPSWGRAEQMLPSVVRSIPSTISKQLLKIEMRGKVGGKEGDLQFTKRPVPGLVDPLLQMRDRMMGKGN
jgi:hypothetical protein